MVLSARKRVQGQCTQHACRLEGTDGKEPGKPICANAVTTSGLCHTFKKDMRAAHRKVKNGVDEVGNVKMLGYPQSPV